jgi:hypothetical protein
MVHEKKVWHWPLRPEEEKSFFRGIAHRCKQTREINYIQDIDQKGARERPFPLTNKVFSKVESKIRKQFRLQPHNAEWQ